MNTEEKVRTILRALAVTKDADTIRLQLEDDQIVATLGEDVARAKSSRLDVALNDLLNIVDRDLKARAVSLEAELARVRGVCP